MASVEAKALKQQERLVREKRSVPRKQSKVEQDSTIIAQLTTAAANTLVLMPESSPKQESHLTLVEKMNIVRAGISKKA